MRQRLTWKDWFVIDSVLWALAALSYVNERKHA